MANSTDAIKRADSHSTSISQAIEELDQALVIDESAFTLFFCGNQYCEQNFADEMRVRSTKSLVVGCSSAGEIGSRGYTSKSITAMSFAANEFKVAANLIKNVKDFTSDQARQIASTLREELGAQGVEDFHSCFALLLVDGMSISEEPLAYRMQHALGSIPLVGGSAGDELIFERTQIFYKDSFYSDAAVIVLVYTERPWEAFKEQHFRPGQTKVVVTDADPENRIVRELNGELAAVEYARLLGLSGPEALTEEHFARNPLMLMLADAWYIRSPQKANPDGSLSMFCAIDVGLVLALGVGVNMVDELSAKLADIKTRIGTISITIACDCIQRRMELENTGMLESASKVLVENNAVGFNTYGEQFGALHINQTLTGVAIG